MADCRDDHNKRGDRELALDLPGLPGRDFSTIEAAEDGFRARLIQL